MRCPLPAKRIDPTHLPYFCRFGAENAVMTANCSNSDWKPRNLDHLERALIHLRMEKSGSCFWISRSAEFLSSLSAFEFSRIRPKSYRKLECSLQVVDYTDSMAESEGFEPPIPFQVCRFSRPMQSTALPTLRTCDYLSIGHN